MQSLDYKIRTRAIQGLEEKNEKEKEKDRVV